MKPMIAELVPAEAWQMLDQVRAVVAALPDSIETPAFIMGMRLSLDVAVSNIVPSCHHVTRALAQFFPLIVHDGIVKAARGDQMLEFEHSWVTIKGIDQNIILDPWPLGVVSGPALFLQDYAYRFGPECCPIFLGTEEFESQVDSLTVAVQDVIDDLSRRRRAA